MTYESRVRQQGVDTMNKQLSTFTRAVIARNAPHLCPVQVATLKGRALKELDTWVNTLADNSLSEFAVWLQDREHDMKALLACVETGISELPIRQ